MRYDHDKDFETFLESYSECALWSTMDESTQDENGNPTKSFEQSESPLSDDCRAAMRSDCKDFLGQKGIVAVINRYGSFSRAGSDFWLTRNGHGAGFWDGDWPSKPNVGGFLTRKAKEYGSVDLYVGDDGEIHQS